MVASSPDQITLAEFQDALARYDQLVEAVSSSKGAKSGQKTLVELDVYRYVEAPARFASRKPGSNGSIMQLEDVKTLVEWKLKHGKFRPTLMKLVSSNDASLVEKTVKESLEVYERKANAPAAVDVLTRLKGIGPATASLLLAVHDPDNVVFFADEAFYWLCNHGRKDPIKYNAKEYAELCQEAQALAKRLDVKSVEIERVAYVLMSYNASTTAEKIPEKAPKKDLKKDPKKPTVKVEHESKTTASKRKIATDDKETTGLRRSKRGKSS